MLGWFLAFIGIMVGIGLIAGRRGADSRRDYLLGGRRLGPLSIGISAAATANSGFIMLGAVGLGYSLGATWLLLPIAWLLGDLIFWRLFPHRMNEAARQTEATTLPELLSPRSKAGWRSGRLVVGALMLIVVGAYGASQVLAGSKSLGALFGLSASTGAALTAGVVGLYSLWGGFRASVWTDLVQGAMMIVLTTWCLISVGHSLWAEPSLLEKLWAMPGQLAPFSGKGAPLIAGFFLSWAAAAIGFGLSQPQVAARYFAGRDEATVRKAKWIYIGFIQFTWVGMTLFGVLVRAIMTNVNDPEIALLAYAQQVLPNIGVAFVFASVFAAIVSTLDSIVLSLGGIVSSDMLPAIRGAKAADRRIVHVTSASVTLLIVFLIAVGSSMNVFQLSVLPVELVAASVGPVAAVDLLRKGLATHQVVAGVILGVVGVLVWRQTGLEPFVSSSVAGLLTFIVIFRWSKRTSRP